MSVGSALGLALIAIRKNLLRSALALTGLVIGVAAVVTMVALGEGAREEVSEEVGSAGTNRVFVRAGNYVRGGDASGIPSGFGEARTLTTEDARELGNLPGVRYMMPLVEDRGPLRAGGREVFALVVGSGADLLSVEGAEILQGRFLTATEVEEAAEVAVLGRALRDALFGAEDDPAGRRLRLRDAELAMVGVGGDPETLYLPFTLLQRLLGIDHLHGVTLSAESAGEASRIAEEARRLLRDRHGLDDPERAKSLPQATGPFAMRGPASVPDDFTIRTEAARALVTGLYTPAAALVLASMPRLDRATSEEMVSTLARANQTMTFLLASIASLSLLVGGIGVMNVMLLSVTERTTEVGLRMSVGAKNRDVLLQFLLEAVCLGLAGGAVGILVGIASAFALTRFLDWPTHVSAGTLALGFGLAFAVGVVFGYYPAHRASRLDPIDALRYE